MSIRNKRSKRSKSKRTTRDEIGRKSSGKIISVKDTNFTRKWFLSIDKDIKKTRFTSYRYVADKIEEVLNNPLGWKRFGYKFERITPKEGLKLSKDKSNWKFIFHMRLSSEATILKECKMKGLSCADLTTNQIFMNVRNWLYPPKASGFTREEGMYYIVSHEIAHLFGKNHNKFPNDPNKPCPILTQQTVRPSPNSCFPNVYPLESDFLL
jgi:hypothetical protein